MNVQLKPIPLRVANDFLDQHGAELGAVRGCKFSIGAYVGPVLVGVVVVERPKARHLDDGWTLELSRLNTCHGRDVASTLVSAATRAAFAMGTRYVLAYAAPTDGGEPYQAAGWVRMEADGKPVDCGGGEWSRPSRRRQPVTSPDRKHRWERYNPATTSHLD